MKTEDLNQQAIFNEVAQGRELKSGYYFDAYMAHNGELVYRICDDIGLVFDSIFPNKLDPYFKDKE